MESTRSPRSVYPDLGDMSIEESDPLPPLQSLVPKSLPPKRPPPPRSTSVPMNIGPAPKAGKQKPANTPSPTMSGASPPSPLATRQLKIPPLKPHEIRWFYEEPGKAWTPFNGHDSLCLEDCYQGLQKGRSSADGCEVPVLGDMYEVNVLDKLCRPIYWTDKVWKVMRGSWFEVSGDKWYPLEEKDSVRVELEHCRDGWRNRASDLCKIKKQAVQAPPDACKSTTDAVVMNRLSLEKYDVLWLSNDTIFKQKNEIASQLWSMMGEKLGKGLAYGAARYVSGDKVRTRGLQRGYKDAASHEHREPPVGHLVLIVHGIGQNMDTSDINKDAASFRTACAQVAKKHFPDEWAQERVEFLPCEWRTWLTLDKGLLNTIIPHGVRKIRSAINDSIIDVVYYLSPKYGPELLDGLRFSIHKQYNEFMKRNPNFNGTVSMFAHSLGSALVYDLLVHTCEDMGIDHFEPNTESNGTKSPVDDSSSQKKAVEVRDESEVKYNRSAQSSSVQLSSAQQQDMSPQGQDEIDFKVSNESTGAGGAGGSQLAARMELEQLKRRVAKLERQLELKPKRGLKFTVDHFFAVGSPLPLFLVMKEHDYLIKKGHRGAASFLPASVCKRVHNVHHPSDPFAYRLEPLVNSLYEQIKPVKLDSASSKPSKESVDLAQGPREEQQPPPRSKGWSFGIFSSSKKSEPPPEPAKVSDNVAEDDRGLRAEERLKERLDFMLRESIAEISYISSLKAHFGYWSSTDCAQYVLLQIYTFKHSSCSASCNSS